MKKERKKEKQRQLFKNREKRKKKKANKIIERKSKLKNKILDSNLFCPRVCLLVWHFSYASASVSIS